MEEGQTKILLNVLVMGLHIVGKSKLVGRFRNEAFNDNYRPTWGVDFGRWDISEDPKVPGVLFWDVSSRESAGMLKYHLSKAHVLTFVWEPTEYYTFRSISTLLAILKNVQFSFKDMPVLFVRTKSDLVVNREISEKERVQIQSWAREYGITCFDMVSVSAKDDIEPFKIKLLQAVRMVNLQKVATPPVAVNFWAREREKGSDGEPQTKMYRIGLQ